MQMAKCLQRRRSSNDRKDQPIEYPPQKGGYFFKVSVSYVELIFLHCICISTIILADTDDNGIVLHAERSFYINITDTYQVIPLYVPRCIYFIEVKVIDYICYDS
jgi:hypothetical protein